jgi:hypothetical protein
VIGWPVTAFLVSTFVVSFPTILVPLGRAEEPAAGVAAA